LGRTFRSVEVLGRRCKVKIRAKSPKGGAVVFNQKHNAWASYAVASVADFPPPELLYAGVTLPDGRLVTVFVNRETGLIVVDVVDKTGNSGTEVFRRTI
jgi:hypothetical protein